MANETVPGRKYGNDPNGAIQESIPPGINIHNPSVGHQGGNWCPTHNPDQGKVMSRQICLLACWELVRQGIRFRILRPQQVGECEGELAPEEGHTKISSAASSSFGGYSWSTYMRVRSLRFPTLYFRSAVLKCHRGAVYYSRHSTPCPRRPLPPQTVE